MTLWRQRIRLWSAVAVCALLVPLAFAAYMLASYVRGLWRDVQYWRYSRRLYKYSQK